MSLESGPPELRKDLEGAELLYPVFGAASARRGRGGIGRGDGAGPYQVQ
jgi:hypothetical protein